jgi:hypothetical protein
LVLGVRGIGELRSYYFEQHFQPHNLILNLFSDAYPLLQSSENLFVDFLSTICVESTGLEALDQVAEFEDLVSDQVNALKSRKGALAHKIIDNVSFNDLLVIKFGITFKRL